MLKSRKRALSRFDLIKRQVQRWKERGSKTIYGAALLLIPLYGIGRLVIDWIEDHRPRSNRHDRHGW